MDFFDNLKEKLKNKVKNKIKQQTLKAVLNILHAIAPYLLAIIGITLVIGILFTIYNSVAEKLGGLVGNNTTYVSSIMKKITDDYWIDLSEEYDYDGNPSTEEKTLVEQYISELETLGISLQDLRILGEANYDDPNLLEDSSNKSQIEKYIKAFVSADLITSQIHRRDGTGLTKVEGSKWLSGPLSNMIIDTLSDTDQQMLADKIDGGIYLYRTKDVTQATGNNEQEQVEEEEVPQVTTPTVDTTKKNINTSSYGLTAEEVNIEMDNITQEYKIAWISDLHMMQPNESTVNNEWYTNHSTTFKERNNGFNNSYSILPKIIECLNGNDFDAIVFGGDIMDNYSTENFNYLKEQINKLTNKNIMFLVADHDYLTEMTTNSGANKAASSLGVSGTIKQITIGENGDSITLVGQNYSNEGISDSAVNTLSNYLNKADNSLFFTHVPVESKTEASEMQSWSRKVHNNEVYYWSNAATSKGYSNPSSSYLNALYNSSSLKGVFAGHVHASGDFELNTGIKEHIFNAAFRNNIGVITLTPSGNVEEREQNTEVEQDKSEIDEIDNYYRMKYVAKTEFDKKIEDFNKSSNPNISEMEKLFAVDDNGNLWIAEVNGQTKVKEVDGDIESTEHSYTAEAKQMDYQSLVSEFGLPYEFLINLCMITQNPEYVFRVAQMCLDTKIDLLLINNETTKITIKERKETEHHEDGTTTTHTIITTTTEKSTNPKLELKYANAWSKYQKNIWSNRVDETTSVKEGDSSKTTKIKITNIYSSIEGNIIRKSDNFLGLLRNESGQYIDGTTPSFKVDGCKFDRYGINVEYKIPNYTTYEDPLSKLLSGEEMLYSLLGQNERTQPLIELMQYYMSYPEQEYYELDEQEVEEILGGYGEEQENYVGTDYIVKTDESGALEAVTKQELINIINATFSGNQKTNALSIVDTLIECQNKYKVNAVFVLAFARQETSVGTANTNYVKNDNNWLSWNLGKKFSSPQENVRTVMNKMATGSIYFKTGKITIAEIGHTYCPNDSKHPTQGDNWVQKVTSYVSSMYNKIGVEVEDSVNVQTNNKIVQQAAKCMEYLQNNGYTYPTIKGVGIPEISKIRSTKNAKIDCSAYVSWVLYELGYMNGRWNSATFASNPKNWKKITSKENIKAGDIVVYQGHVEICAEDVTDASKLTKYNAGSTNAIKKSPYSSGWHANFKFALRILN